MSEKDVENEMDSNSLIDYEYFYFLIIYTIQQKE